MKGSRDRSKKDADRTESSVAQCIEKLQQSSSTALEKELSLKQILDLINTRKTALFAVGYHSQAISILISLLRTGSTGVKNQSASVLGSLCKEDELRVNVLHGGCIPPLVSLLKSSSSDGKIVAAKTIHAISQGGASDHVGSKIFSTEGVVRALWEQLQIGLEAGSVVNNFLTGALRNLSSRVDNFWLMAKEFGGEGILVNLLAIGQLNTLADVCFLLSCMVMEDASVCSIVLATSSTKKLLKLLEYRDELSVRAEAVGALKSLSSQCNEAKLEIASDNGIYALINATIAPSKDHMQGEHAQALQENAVRALANVSGGLSHVITSLCESIESSKSPTHTADNLGALASALASYDDNEKSIRKSDPMFIEKILIKQFKSKPPFFGEERITEALTCLYGNAVFSKELCSPDEKRLLVELITMVTNEARDELLHIFLFLCNSEGNLWHALQDRAGLQLLISMLGISSEQQQEHAIALLSLLSNTNNESKWAITSAGGIPRLIQILKIGSQKAKENSAKILGNLCNQCEDIKACVESADVIPDLLWILKNGSDSGKETAAKTMRQFIRISDTGTISQLSGLLTSDQPESKVHILDTLKSYLFMAPLSDMVQEGSAANGAVEMVIKILSLKKVEAQSKSALILAELFHCRKDLRETYISVKALSSAVKLLTVESENILMGASRCLAAIFLSIREKHEFFAIAKDALDPLALLANSSSLEVSEHATQALANVFLDPEISVQASPENIIFSMTNVLRDGTVSGRTHAATAIARLLQFRSADHALLSSINRAGTVIALLTLLKCSSVDSAVTSEALNALTPLSGLKEAAGNETPPYTVLVKHPNTIALLIPCITHGAPVVQDKSIEILSKLCEGQHVVLGSEVANTSGCVLSIARRVIESSLLKIKVGGAALLICAAKEHKQTTLEFIMESNLSSDLIHSLIKMLESIDLSSESGDIEYNEDIIIYRNQRENSRNLVTSVISGATATIWLLSVIACHDDKSKVAIMDAGGLECLAEMISNHISSVSQSDSKEYKLTWVCALLLAILFQNRDIIEANATMLVVPILVSLLRLVESANRYFAAQAICSLVCNGSRSTILSIANSGAIDGLIPLLGYVKLDISDLLELAEEFLLVAAPDQIALERLFRVEGAATRNAMHALVDLLEPIPERPGAPYLALRFMTQLAIDSPMNQLLMVESGSLEALTEYLSLGTQDVTVEVVVDLMGILFSSVEIRMHDSAYGAVNQLVAVLHLGRRSARCSACKALECLFSSDHIRYDESAMHSIHPLVEILNIGSEKEQHASIAALVRFFSENPSRVPVVDDAKLIAVNALCRILLSNCLLELKVHAAELCCVLFADSRIRSAPATSCCVEPLISLLTTEYIPAQHSAVRSLDRLLDDKQLAQQIAAHCGVIVSLVKILVGRNYTLHEAVSRALEKLGKDKPECKIDMVNAAVIIRVLDILPDAPDSLYVAFAALLRILTNDACIAKGTTAAKVVDPIFLLLKKLDFSHDGHYNTLRVLLNILEHPQCRVAHNLTPSQNIQPIIALLNSPVQAVQQVAAELLFHLLLDDHLRKDEITQQAIGPLIRVLSSGLYILRQKALKVLVNISLTWPNVIAKHGGIYELSKIILQNDPPLPCELWEYAATVLSHILQFSSEFYLEVDVAVLVQLLYSVAENTLAASLNVLLVLVGGDLSIAKAMNKSGVVQALLELLISHQCEESAARLLEKLFNNIKVRETDATRYAISQLSLYLLDPKTQSPMGRMLSALVLSDLFKNEALVHAAGAILACRALVNFLADRTIEEMKVVTLRALQNLVKSSRSNKREVAESGGVQVVLGLISSSAQQISIQAAVLIKLLFNDHTIQEYASSQTVHVLTATIEKNLLADGNANEEYLKVLTLLLGNHSRLRSTKSATLSIPVLVTSLKTNSEAIQEAALDSLFFLRQAWPLSLPKVSKTQSVAISEAIPLFQHFIKSGHPRFKIKAEILLLCLPGTLTVIIKRGNNLKQRIGNPCVYCEITLGKTPPRETKAVLFTSPMAEWNEIFTWVLDIPPKDQKLNIRCRNKSRVGKKNFGSVSIEFNDVIKMGSLGGVYDLLPPSKSGVSRNLELEAKWSSTQKV